jgi:hypothetical protein
LRIENVLFVLQLHNPSFDLFAVISSFGHI